MKNNGRNVVKFTVIDVKCAHSNRAKKICLSKLFCANLLCFLNNNIKIYIFSISLMVLQFLYIYIYAVHIMFYQLFEDKNLHRIHKRQPNERFLQYSMQLLEIQYKIQVMQIARSSYLSNERNLIQFQEKLQLYIHAFGSLKV